MRKDAPMYFEIHTQGKHPYGYIRNSYRNNGKVCHDTFSRINNCSVAQLTAMKKAFETGNYEAKNIKLLDAREYGASKALYDFARKIGLDKLIYSRTSERWVGCVLAMIIGRIVFAGSKLELSKRPITSCLWEICAGIESDEPIDVNKFCYAPMDELLARKDLIQKKLAGKHLHDGCVVLYDITSSYFEGACEDSDLVAFGYNRDKKEGHKQIVIGLVCTGDGCPVSVEVFRGNTNDASTVQNKAAEIGKKYGIKDIIFVGDRGMLTKANLDNLKDLKSITALTHAKIKWLCEQDCVQLSMFDKDKLTEVTLPEEPGVRYALKLNPVRAERDKSARLRIIERIEKKLEVIANSKKKEDDAARGKRVGKAISVPGFEKFFIWRIENGKLTYARNTDKIAEEEQYDGLYVIRTNVSAEVMSTSEFVQTYKNLINVEQAFRNMKTVNLEIRPIYHKTDERIKAHVFICMLAYYLLWHVKKALKPLYDNDKVYTDDMVIDILKSRQKHHAEIGELSCEIVSEETARQAAITKLLQAV